MKYLELYEDYSEETLYKEIDKEEFLECLYSKNRPERLNLSEYELSKLSIFGEAKNRLLRRVFRPKAILELPNFVVNIYKTFDEWMYVSLSEPAAPVPLRNHSGKFYKCDSIDGVIQLLNSIS